MADIRTDHPVDFDDATAYAESVGARRAAVVEVELPIPDPGALIMRCGHVYFRGIDPDTARILGEMIARSGGDEEFVLVTTFEVRCEDREVASRIFCKPGASPEELESMRLEIGLLRAKQAGELN